MTPISMQTMEALRAALRALDGAAGVTLLGDWQWHATLGHWLLRCRLEVAVPAGSRVPEATNWYAQVTPAYPAGGVMLWPDKDGGLTETFAHQGPNDAGPPEVPFRTGWICLQETRGAWKSQPREPLQAEGRLLWSIQRALAWLQAAARDELQQQGEALWLPLLPSRCLGTLLYNEGPEHLAEWRMQRGGLVRLRLAPLHGGFLVEGLDDRSGRIWSCRTWGNSLQGLSALVSYGAVIRLNAPPLISPCRLPKTWGELRQVLHGQGLDLDAELRPLLSAVAGDTTPRLLVLAAPIPERVGDAPQRMHLWALALDLSARGPTERDRAWWRRQAKSALAASAPLRWMATENWHHSQVGARGQLDGALRQRRALLIGAGSVGSALAEMLVRGGMRSLVVMDGETLQIGNLARHTGMVIECGLPKATTLVARMSMAMPHADVTGVAAVFPPTTAKEIALVQGCDLVLDVTGEDSVVARLAEHPWAGERLFLSISLGAKARRLFCFAAYGRAFPLADFHSQLQPWLLREQAEGGEAVAQSGCHDPFFPARVDEVWLMAALAVKWIERCAATPPGAPTLLVIARPEPVAALLPQAEASMGC